MSDGMQLEKLVLQANTPKYLTLAFDSPREGDSARPDGTSNHWYRYTVVDEVGVNYSYFPPETINAYLWLERKGYVFTVMETATIEGGRAKKKTDIWDGWVDVTQVAPKTPVATSPTAPPKAPPVSGTAPPQKVPQTPPTVPSQARPAVPSIPQKQTVKLSDVANTMEACIIVAQDIAAAWTEEQQQSIAVSMFICLTRENRVYLTREQVKATAAFYAGGIPKEATKYGSEDDGSVDYEPPPDDVDYSDEPPQGEEGLPSPVYLFKGKHF